MAMDRNRDDVGGNAFFSNGAAPEAPSKGRLYAAIEVPEADEESRPEKNLEPIYFECVDASWLQNLNPGMSWKEVYRIAPLSVLELHDYPLPAFPEQLQPGDIAWFEFGYAPPKAGDITSTLYTSLFSEGISVAIQYREALQPGWPDSGPMSSKGWPKEVLISHDSKLGLKAISGLLEQVETSGGVAIYDVGHGACQGLLENNHRIPSLYVDFGGGVLGNAKTFPKNHNGFCFTKRPAVILSHWDWDHWSSAYRYPIALDTRWIAPPVPKKPIQQAFAADLLARSNLLIWDGHFPSALRVGGVGIERCTGKTTNDSGLAVTVYPGPRGRKNYLLPGDAGYRHIPSVARGDAFSAICITHHGGKLHSVSIPKAKQRGYTVCSLGAGNTYKHPYLHTLEKHMLGGWPLPLVTGFTGKRPSHIFMSWDSAPEIFEGSCHASGCSVAYTRHLSL
ncbi:hypothetical protein [Pseudomonas sp. P9_31]|uniref:hypothetical protein n=1 Tax=Pseudomonas sp. P9_31 TaxID=3043448 RepID=UPI002A36B6F4|nr:hypothetical protein [Pseudomonas sp. P9_31]WPN55368.1 hypothetical protein QMK51_14240 [Pseudomonas sp. P9_31]